MKCPRCEKNIDVIPSGEFQEHDDQFEMPCSTIEVSLDPPKINLEEIHKKRSGSFKGKGNHLAHPF